jgi:hypothetical protein
MGFKYFGRAGLAGLCGSEVGIRLETGDDWGVCGGVRNARGDPTTS